MADIFISYSKSDRPLALHLSAFLEAEGWTVWWDKSLSAGDTYRDEIMKQLAAARAVVTIWSESSIRSDWVRAESGRAKADGKLIPVKTAGLTYADIPLPFGEMHTESIGAPDLIRAAVVAQLARPAAQASAVSLATRAIRLHLLTWTGIVGGAITLFTNAKEVLNLADWARWVILFWQDWTHAFWTWMFGWVGVNISREFVPLLSFTAFTLMLVVGTRMRASDRAIRTETKEIKSTTRADLRRFMRLQVAYIVYLIVLTVLLSIIDHTRFKPEWDSMLRNHSLVGLCIYIVVPIMYVLYASRERTQCLVSAVLYLFFSIVLVVGPLLAMVLRKQVEMDSFSIVTIAFLPLVLQLGLTLIVSFAPLRAVNRRLVFIVIGVFLLVALNEISKLNLYQYFLAPRPAATQQLQ
jgi:hypothetical protein